MIAALRNVEDHGHAYSAILIMCPACDDLHMLPVGGDVPPGKPKWEFNGNLEEPTLSPSILTRMFGYPKGIDPVLAAILKPSDQVCHSFLRNGVWEFLGDCTHAFAGQHIPSPELPEWVFKESKEE